MSLGNYPIIKIKGIPPSLKKEGIDVWYWHYKGCAFDCPLEPLIAEYWEEKVQSRLIYGVALPSIYEFEGGDLIVLVSQVIKDAEDKNSWGISSQQKHELFDLIMDIDLPHVAGLSVMTKPMQLVFLDGFSEAFRKHILPIKDKDGKYYRDNSEDYKIYPLDSNGCVKCQKCGRTLKYMKDLVFIGVFPLDDQTIGAVECQYCGEKFYVSMFNS